MIRLVLRIRYDDEAAVISLGDKFGCHPVTEAPKLIEISKSLGLNVCRNDSLLQKTASTF